MKKKFKLNFFYVLFLVVFSGGLFFPCLAGAAELKSSYPRLANYFLKWRISDAEVKELAKWDVLILDMETQENSRAQLQEIRRLNPEVIILAYITSQEIIDDISNYNEAYLRQEVAKNIVDGWWLKDAQGQKVCNWPGTSMLNLSNNTLPDSQGNRFNDYLPEFVINNLKSSGLWDGVFYDNTWGDVSWVNSGNLDVNNDGEKDSAAQADNLWAAGFKKMLAKTRSLAGKDFIIVGNGNVYFPYQSLLNGMMLEHFPSSWENGGTWSGSMATYLRLPGTNVYPQIPVINVYDKNQNNFTHFRFGLTSALLGDGFYSFDYDVTSHGQTWWYDEYDVNLGTAQSAPYNLLDNSSQKLKPGLWRRDFKNGVVIVNSTNKKQTYVLNKEELEKIKGNQDPAFNNGQRVNYVQLAPSDGGIFLKRSNIINDAIFTNGYFYRVFNIAGKQTSDGFFSYLNSYPGAAEVISTTGATGRNIGLSAANGKVSVYHDGGLLRSFYPYSKNFKKSLSLDAFIVNGYFQKIVTGAGLGGGPQVMVFNSDGKLITNFFAYNKDLRGGVNVAIGDVNGDGQLEIVTGPGPGDISRVKIFSLSGALKTSFLAYDSKFHGGVNVAVGDVNGDGQAEIITGPASNGSSEVKIFSANGKLLGNFLSYYGKSGGGIKVSATDINNDGQAEILVGLKNFY
jgi:hypothetical protein